MGVPAYDRRDRFLSSFTNLNDPRERKPKADDPDYSQKLLAHEAFQL